MECDTPHSLPVQAPYDAARRSQETTPTLSILIPVFNERRTLRTIVRRVLASPIPIPIELVIVDDGSRDGSTEIIQELAAEDDRIKPVFHETNQGKGGGSTRASGT